MNIEEIEAMFGLTNDNQKFFYAQVPRCVILDKRVRPIELRVYIYLISRCCQDKRFTWVSQTTIAEDLGMARESVNRLIRRLVSMKLIRVGKRDSRNIYSIADVTVVYGEEVAQSQWKKRGDSHTNDAVTKESPPTPPVIRSSHGCDQTVTSTCDRIVTPPVIRSSHKEEEVQESEIQESERRGGHTPPPVGTSPVKNLTWESTHCFAEIFAELVKGPRIKDCVDKATLTDWLDGQLLKTGLSVSEIVSEAKEWAFSQNQKPARARTTSPVTAFGNWLRIAAERKKESAGGRTGKAFVQNRGNVGGSSSREEFEREIAERAAKS